MKRFERFKILALVLFTQSLLICIIISITTAWFDGSKCINTFQRPYENHRIKIIEKSHSLPLQELERNDLTKLLNLTDFQFINRNEIGCNHLQSGANNINNNNNLLLLIIVPSAVQNQHKRDCIRKTWGDAKYEDLKILFMLGQSQDEEIKKNVQQESEFYGDIVQGNFIDSYRNLSYKAVMSFKYVIYHCPHTRYVLKMDDDSFVNIPLLINFLKHDLSPFGAENLFLCNDMTGSPVLRDNRSQWYVPYEVFPNESYPSYCSGWYALFSPDICFKLYKEAQKINYYLSVDDAFVYGVASRNANLTHTDISYLTLAYKNITAFFNGDYDNLPILFGPMNMNVKLIERMFEYFKKLPVPETVFGRF